jgi:DNA-binding IscR family transcriptional regulator
VHNFWKDARQQIESTLRYTTLADVIAHERRMARSRAAR